MKHISICICTFKRPHLLQRLLQELDGQLTKELFTYSIIVVDNDCTQSAQQVASNFADRSSIDIQYHVEPKQNIANARNRTLANAQGDYIAFIDDDEYPVQTWLISLFETCEKYAVAGVLGPVMPDFEQDPPKWTTKGRFHERPTHETGYQLGLSEARTGNVLLRREILDGVVDAFGAEFGTGGEDVDFFRRMMNKGCTFIWCKDAIVYEIVPPSRCTRGYFLRRALLRGSNSLRQPSSRTWKLFKSFIAVLAYTLALPVLFVAGDHYFMKYLIKLCDHGGRILAFLSINPVVIRDP